MRDALRHRDEVRVSERLERREAVHPSGDGLEDASVAHGVECLPIDAQAQRFGNAEFPELARPLADAVSTHEVVYARSLVAAFSEGGIRNTRSADVQANPSGGLPLLVAITCQAGNPGDTPLPPRERPREAEEADP